MYAGRSLEHPSHHRTLGHVVGNRRGGGEACSVESGTERGLAGTPYVSGVSTQKRENDKTKKHHKIESKNKGTNNSSISITTQQEQEQEQLDNTVVIGHASKQASEHHKQICNQTSSQTST